MSCRLTYDDVSVVVDDAAGGRLASLTIGGREVLAMPPGGVEPLNWGSYPMVPWVGRTRRGVFHFDGREHRLPINLGAHAIHGTGFAKPWRLVRSGSLAIELECELSAPDRHDWPFGGVATQRFELEPDSLTCWLEVRATDGPMPADVGWHPWFVKPSSIGFDAAGILPRDDDYICGPTPVTPPPPPWDDCFTGVTQPVALHWPGLSIEMTSSCGYWVVYDMPIHATCVEPQSGPPNSLNTGATRLAEGESLQHWMRLSWSRRG